MPQAIPFIVQAGFTALGATATTIAVATVVATVAVGLYERDRAKQKARDAYNKSLQDRTISIRSGVNERSYVLGTVRTSGTVMYIEPIGTNKEALDLVLAMANNECEIGGWYLNEDFISLGAFPGDKYAAVKHKNSSEKFTVTGPTATVTLTTPPDTSVNAVKAVYRKTGAKGTATIDSIVGADVHLSDLPSGSSQVTVTYDSRLGDPLQAFFMPGTVPNAQTNWGDAYPSPGWTSNHRLDGCAATRTLFTWTKSGDAFESGAPTVGAVLTGRARAGYAFYDPRDESHPVTTSNPAILAGWWMTLPRILGGCGIPSDWIDWQSVAAAANICDELVTLKNLNGTGYTQGKRYECHTMLPTSDAPLVNLETILSAMAGRKAFTGGKYKIVAGAFRPATMTITDADIVGTQPITASTYSGDDVPPNACTATFADAANNWMVTSPQPVRNQDYIDDDHYEKAIDLSLAATTDARRAQYLMGVAIEGSRPAMTIQLTLGGIGENLAIYDTAQFDIVNRPQYGGRTFELLESEDNWDGTFLTTWAEIRAQTWALDPDKFTPSNPVTPGDNSYLFNPSPPQNFAVAAVTPQTLPDGTAVMQVELTWDALAAEGNTPAARVELRFRVAGGDWVGIAAVPGDATGTTISAALLDGEVYQFQARYLNGIGQASEWVDAWTQIAGTPLPAPLSLRLRPSSTIFRVPQTGNALPVSISLDVVRTAGLTEAAVFATLPVGITLGGSGDNRTLAYADMGANDSVQITVKVTQGGIDYVDTVTILKVFDGADADDEPDETPPPAPTNLGVQSFLVHLLVTWDPAAYTQGHGHAATIVYAAPVPAGGPQPTLANAVAVGSSETSGFVFAAAPGTTWAIWARHQSRDGVQSLAAGGTNGVQQTTAKIGNTNLGPLVIEAGNLADAAVTAQKIAASALDATKFASSIQPVGIVSSVPSTLGTRTVFNTADGKLYRWNGSSYVATTPAGDITGQLGDAQIAAVAAAKLTGLIAGTQITDGAISTPKLAAGAVTTNELAANAVTANNIAAGQITTTKLAAGAVDANALAANSVVAGKIAAGAVSATEIAAGAVTTSKLVVTGRGAALNDDPACVDNSAWITDVGPQAQANTPSSLAPGGTVLRLTANSGSYNLTRTRAFPIVPGKRYRLSAYARQVSGGGAFYLRLWQVDAAGTNVAYDIGVEGVTLSGSFVRYSGVIDAAATATQAYIYFWSSYSTGPGVVDMADIRCEEVIPGELIVDGAITATKIAAGAIAVGSAAIANGAITNAMIGNATIDNAKILDLSVAKITGGTLGAEIQVGAGKIIYDNGTFLRAQGTGFGSSNQFIDWYGPRPAGGNLTQCTEANATFYLKTNGDSYFGGSLSAGVFKNAAQTTNTTATAFVSVGPFLTNGGNKTVVLSYRFLQRYEWLFHDGSVSSSPTPAAQIILEKSLNGGNSWTTLTTMNVMGTVTQELNGPGESSFADVEMSGAQTITDTQGATNNLTYRARINSRTVPTASGTFLAIDTFQTLGFVSTE